MFLIRFFVVVVFALLPISCLHTGRPGTRSLGGGARITITDGNAVLRIHAQVNRNVYAETHWTDEQFYRPVVRGGTVTRNEIEHLSTGDEIRFWIMPSEVVTVNIVSLDGNDVQITSLDTWGRETTRTLPGANAMGLTLAFVGR